MSFFVQGGVEDEQPFTGTCPTCGQTDLRAENERLRKLNDDNIKIMVAEIERLRALVKRVMDRLDSCLEPTVPPHLIPTEALTAIVESLREIRAAMPAPPQDSSR